MTLRVKFEIVPQGDESRTRELGRVDVSIKDVLARNRCNYNVSAYGVGMPDGWVDEITEYARDQGYLALATIAVNIVDQAVMNRQKGSDDDE